MDINAMLNAETRPGRGRDAHGFDAVDPSLDAAAPTAVAPAQPSSAARDSPAANSDEWDIQQAASLLATLSAPRPQPYIKPNDYSSQATCGSSSEPGSSIHRAIQDDRQTALAIQQANNEHSTRRRKPKPMSASPAAASPAPPSPSAVPTPKKKPPKSATKAKTGDGAKKGPASKKRKIEDERSATPSSVAGKKTSAKPRKQSTSATPVDGPSPDAAPADDMEEDDDDGSVEDADAVYCICRKPDNHTWMIGCDGGCDDWYHGKCVNMRQEDEQLIDKFICPICTERSDTVTTWKPMCRFEGCRNPARLKKGSESKYCSDRCGELFMADMLKRAPASRAPARTIAERRKPGVKGSDLADNEDIGPLGGTITAPELKSLVVACGNANEFRNMGDIVALTPPDSTVAEEHDKDQPAPVYEQFEQSRLDEIATVKARLYERRMLLKIRSKFVMMARDRTGRMRQSNKDVCGYDPRLAYDERRFASWAESPEGRTAVERNTLEDPKPRGAGDEEGEPDDIAVCMRRRCKKHSEWQKIALHDVRFEEAEVGDEMRGIDAEETTLRRAGLMRARELAHAAPEEHGLVEAVDEDMPNAP